MLCIDVEYRYRNIEISSRKVSAIPYLFKCIDYTRKFDINKPLHIAVAHSITATVAAAARCYHPPPHHHRYT